MPQIESPHAMFDRVGLEHSTIKYAKGREVFSQGETCDAIFYVLSGQIKLSVISDQGKEAIIAILEPGSLFGEQCLAGHSVRTASAATLQDASLIRIEKIL